MNITKKTDSKTIVFAKDWQESGVSAAVMLFVYGTLPEPDSITPDSFSQALSMGQQEMQAALEEISTGDTAQDLTLAAGKFTVCLQKVNARLREASQFLGQGIYMGGTVLYGTAQQMFAFAFGNGALYAWNGTSLELLSEAPPADNLIRDTLGGKEIWIGNCLQLDNGTNAMVLATGFFRELSAPQKVLLSGSADITAQLYALLSQSWTAPHGIIYLSLR